MGNLPQKPKDSVGLQTLEVFAETKAFNAWMYETIRPFCKTPILEVGSGIGNLSSYFIQEGATITLSDLNPEYCTILKEKYKDVPVVQDIFQLNIAAEDFEQRYAPHLGRYKTVYALNVIEHIENDQLAIENCTKLLQKDGILIILVPAFQGLYNQLDRSLGHYRRYRVGSLTKIFQKAQLKVIHHQYFNVSAMLGWFIYGKVLGRKVLPVSPVKTYNKLLPFFKVFDWLFNKWIGNSVILIGTPKINK